MAHLQLLSHTLIASPDSDRAVDDDLVEMLAGEILHGKEDNKELNG